MQDGRLYNNSKTLGHFNDVNVPKFLFIQGVPGCGKTTYIKTFVLNNNGVPNDSNKGVMVLFPTKEGAKQFRSQICSSAKLSESSKTLLRRNFRITHS